MHLSADELVDLAEGARPESSAPHLAACGPCRARLNDLRAMMSAVADVDVPEPSPLFWDHFSQRVHDAAASEEMDARGDARLKGSRSVLSGADSLVSGMRSIAPGTRSIVVGSRSIVSGIGASLLGLLGARAFQASGSLRADRRVC